MMVYPAFDQAIVHRPIIHLVKDFLTECNKYNSILERSQFGLPMVGKELDLYSINIFKTTSEQYCDLVYSWPQKNTLANNKNINLVSPRQKIDDFFCPSLIKAIDEKSYCTSNSKKFTQPLKDEPLEAFEDAFITKIIQNEKLYGYIVFTFDYPVQFDQEIIDSLLSFVEMLCMQPARTSASNITVSPSTLLNHTENLVFVLNEYGEINSANLAYEKLMQKDRSLYIGKDFREAFDFVNSHGHITLASVISGKPLDNVCLEVYAFNNEKKWLSFNFTPFTEADTKLILVSASDITYQKEIELKLRKRDLRSHLTSLATHDTCYDWNYKDHSVWWNNNIHEHFGHLYSTNINHRKWWEQHIHPDDINYIKQTFQSAFENKSLTCSLEYRFKFANGDYAYVNDKAFISYDSHANVMRLTGSIEDISEQRAAELALRNSRDSLSKLANRLQEVREDERKSLARELHDEFAQLLTALKLDIAYLDRHNNSVDKSQIKIMTTIVNQMMDRVQSIARELRPTILDDLGLIHAINWQLNNFYELTDCDITFINKFENIVFKQEAVTAIFRIFQEALSNVARHANATEVFVTVKNLHSRFTLTIKDNGRGISEGHIDDPNAIGLLGMKERAYVLDGDVVIRRNESTGTTVTLLIPIKNCVETYKIKEHQSFMSLPSKTEGELISN